MEDFEPYQIFILLDGYSYEDQHGRYHADGTSTLIKGKLNILVDTGSPRDKDKLLTSLALHNVTTEEIDYVVGTHGHIDHIGNLNLFPKAKMIVGFDICIDTDHYIEHDFSSGENYKIDNEIYVIATPGHTHSDVSVMVKNVRGYGCVIVCGDLYESELDQNDWRKVSEWEEKQLENREKIWNLADYIIPGHGTMFAVTKPTST